MSNSVRACEDENLKSPPPWLEYPVFLCGAPRSGTTFLSNLLDGHPELIVLPIETHALEYTHRQKVNHNEFLAQEYMKTHDVRWYTDANYRRSYNLYMTRHYGKAAAFELSGIDERMFGNCYVHYLEEHGTSLKTVYPAFAWSLHAAGGRTDQPSMLVEKRPLDNELSAKTLKKIFPNAKFIHILRDPRTRYASAKQRRIIRRLAPVARLCLALNGLGTQD